MRVACLLLTAVIMNAADADAQSPPAPTADQNLNLPVSLDRIRTRLERPAGRLLRTLDQRPHFRVAIRERQLFEEKLTPLLYFKPEPVPPGGLYGFEQRQRIGGAWSQPLVSFDLSAIGRSIGHAISNARRERAERAAREEVRKALADFQAAQDKKRP